MDNKIKVDDKLIANLSRLAKLNFNKNAAEKMKADLARILKFVERMGKVDTTGIEPLIYMNVEEGGLRIDKIANEISQQDALKNAPQKDSDYFKVPTVLKK
tara:strand:+ start:1963 stop:2265 length:303 start_codon:yes stop_codon:yes gene_type:complete